MNNKISRTVNFIGFFALVAGILIGLKFIFAGLLAGLGGPYSVKDLNAFLFLISGIVFSVMLIKGGIGVLRHRSSSRVLLIITFYLMFAGIILYLFSSIIDGLGEMGSEYFDVSSWIGGIVFCLFAGTLCVFQAVFLKRPDVKELFKKQAEGVFKNWLHLDFGIASFVILIVIVIIYVCANILDKLFPSGLAGFFIVVTIIGWIIGVVLSIIGLFRKSPKKLLAILSFIGYLLVAILFAIEVLNAMKMCIGSI